MLLFNAVLVGYQEGNQPVKQCFSLYLGSWLSQVDQDNHR